MAGESTFDTLLTPQGQPSPQSVGNGNMSRGNDNDLTNQEGANQFAANLLKTLEQQGKGSKSSEEEAPDFSSLFGESGKPAGTSKTSNQSSSAKQDDIEPEEAPADTGFLGQLSDDKIMQGLISSVVAGNDPLPEDLQTAMFGEGENAMDSIELTPQGMSSLYNAAVAQATRSSMSQTINLLRQLAPALTDQAQAKAADQFQNTKQIDIAMAQFAGNKELTQLAKHLAGGKTITDGLAFAKEVKAFMHQVNNSQLRSTEETKPKQQTTKQFLQAL